MAGMSAAARQSDLDPTIAARLKRDEHGLFPAVAQQWDTGEVLMVGWMDDEALHRTLTTGRCTYWSRSRREYWVKGETSGHQQWVRSVALDCDGDTVLVKVDQVGAACHTGDRTCFDADALPAVVLDRPAIVDAAAPADGAPADGGTARRGDPVTTGEAVPDRAGFARLARGSRLVPVTRRLLADGETPVGVYRKLAGGRPGTFLLESAEHGRSWSRWSFVGVRSSATLSERDGRAVWTGTPPPGAPADGDPLEVLAATWRALLGPAPADELPDLPPLTGGLVGYLGYDVVRRIERLPAYAIDDLGLPELTMLVATDVAVVDHYEASVLLVANALVPPDAPAATVDAAYDDAVARLDAMTRDLATPAPPSIAVTRPVPPAEHVSRTPAGQYQPAVKAALDAVRAGEVFQVQIGQRFETPHRRRRARRLPGAADAEPVAVHVPAAARRVRHRRVVARRRWSP